MVGLTDGACELVRASKLGTPLDKSVTAHRGRNAAFSFQTDAGRSLFLKSIDTQTEAGMKLFEATLTAHHVLSNSTDTAGLHSPAVLASDPDNGIVVQEHVADARMLAELAVASERDSDLLLGAMTSAGRAIASLHAVSASGKGLRSDPSFLPPVEWLDVLPWTSFKTFAAPQLNIWGRLQRDPELKDALI